MNLQEPSTGWFVWFPDPKEIPTMWPRLDIVQLVGTGVGIAEGFARAGKDNKTVVVVGDGALTGGMAFEGP